PGRSFSREADARRGGALRPAGHLPPRGQAGGARPDRFRLVGRAVQAVQGAEFLPYVSAPGLRRQRLAGGALHQLVGRELATVSVDVAAEPTEQRAELSALDLLVEVRDVRSDPLHQLRADQVSDCVAGEDAEAHERPVDVLQRAYPIVGDVDAQVGTDARVPGFGQ